MFREGGGGKTSVRGPPRPGRLAEAVTPAMEANVWFLSTKMAESDCRRKLLSFASVKCHRTRFYMIKYIYKQSK